MTANRGKGPPLVAERRYAQPAAGGGSGGGSGGRGGGASGKGSGGGKRRPAARRRPARRGVFGWLLFVLLWPVRMVWRITWRLGLVVGLIVGMAVLYTASTLPPIEELVDGRTRGSVTLLDREGEVFAWRGDQFGGMVTADTVSRHLRNAVIATEDRRYRLHPGIDPIGIASAIRINLSEGRGPLDGHGGSTITQQTAKLLCLGVPYDDSQWESESAYEADCRRTTLWRKVKEAVYALAMEASYSKDEILTIYLNRAYLGAGARGFEAAAQRYFGKSAAEVTPAEAAMLAGLLKAPSAFDPTSNLSRAQGRANLVIGLMEEQGYLSTAAAAEARAEPARLSAAAERRAGGYFADWVMASGPEFFTRDTTEDVIIRTTLDQDIQAAAEAALAHVFETKVREGSEAQAAIVVMSADGAVRAMVGGRATRVSGVFNRATQALRQTGSAFKPFVYATALELGMSPNDVLLDEPTCFSVRGQRDYCPENYTREYRGPVTMTDALAQSLNIPAVQLSERVGRDNVRTVATQFGIESDLAPGPAIALGTSESTLLEMTGAYAGILNGGSAVLPYGLVELRLQGDDAPLMGTGGGIRERVIRQEAAQQLVWMLHQVVERGTGTRARIDGWQIAGKTGTTQAARDAWFIGFSADYVTGVWMGYDDNTPLTGVTGSGLPAEIWHETMIRVLSGRAPAPLSMLAPAAPVPVPAPPGPQAPGRPDPAADNIAEQVLIDILTDILRQTGN